MNRKVAWLIMPIYFLLVYIIIRIKAPFGYWTTHVYHGNYMSSTNWLLIFIIGALLFAGLLAIIIGNFTSKEK